MFSSFLLARSPLVVDTDRVQMCLAFATVEQKLGEVDRARAVLTYGSQFADPRRAEPYWQVKRASKHCSSVLALLAGRQSE